MERGLKQQQILIVEDEALWRRVLVGELEAAGAEVTAVGNLAEARRCFEHLFFDFVVMDVHLPDGNSLELLREGVAQAAVGIVVMTAEGGIDTAVEAMRLGAGDFLSKPFEAEALVLVLKRLWQGRKNERIQGHEASVKRSAEGDVFFGKRLERIRKDLDRVLETDRRLKRSLPPILLQGETGTGKTRLARWIHEEGPRSEGPFVEVNCAALPENLVESELFGYEKGSFTDAKTDRLGLFEAASGGTLFLDEIGGLTPAVQAKILTAIDSREIRRVGGVRSVAVDVRIIAANLESLESMVREQRFREDLYHRLCLIVLEMPPLRSCREDIPDLAAFLLNRLKRRYGAKGAKISRLGMERLMRAEWRGNLRELAHELERAMIFESEGTLDFERLERTDDGEKRTDKGAFRNEHWVMPEDGFSIEDLLKGIEKELMEEVFHLEKGNVSAMARRLGVSRDYVRYRISDSK